MVFLNKVILCLKDAAVCTNIHSTLKYEFLTVVHFARKTIFFSLPIQFFSDWGKCLTKSRHMPCSFQSLQILKMLLMLSSFYRASLPFCNVVIGVDTLEM